MSRITELVLPRLKGFRFLADGIGLCISIATLLAFMSALPATDSYKNRIATTAMLVNLSKTHNNNANFLGHVDTAPKTSSEQGRSDLDRWNLAGQRILLKDGLSKFDPDSYYFLALDKPFQFFRILDTFEVLIANNPPPLLVYENRQVSQFGILIDQRQMHRHLRPFFLTFFIIQFLVLAGAGLVIIKLMRFYWIKPLDDLVATLNTFSADPAIALPIPASLKGQPEYLDAAVALDRLQRNTLLALRQRERLADIGEAVVKINHDIRNALSSATLVADTMLASNDPQIRRTAPYVVRSLEQAVDLCQSMLDYLVEPPTPKPEKIAVPSLVGDLAERLGATITYDGPNHIFIDRVMITRILTNLIRNAVVAGASTIGIDIWKAGHLAVVDIADNGPGIPETVWHDLFLAFRTTRRGGTGLGLAITRDLAVALGGNIKLARSGKNGSEFRLQLPEQIFHET